MEKQRIKRLIRSGRRFLITALLIFAAAPVFSQTLTLEKIKQLRFVPEESQNLYTKTDIKFIVTIPYVQPSQVQVLAANQKDDITFRTLRKAENYEEQGTLIEIWYNFANKGDYSLAPLSVMIQNRRRSIYFEPVSITDDPATLTPRIVLVFDDGTRVYSDELNFPKPLLTVPTGKKLGFTVNLQYATQLVQFNWEIPKDSIFTCTKQFEFTENRYRERVYSHILLPVASFEWTGLVAETIKLPTIRLSATGYNGYRSELLMPEICIDFTEADEAAAATDDTDIFSAAFYQETAETSVVIDSELSYEDCMRLADYYSKEHNEFLLYPKARRDRINFEESCGIVISENPIFPTIYLYISIIIIVISIVFIIISIRRKHKIRMLMYIVLLILGAAVLFYCAVRRNERYGISAGCKIYSIPQENAESVSEVGRGNRVRILEHTGKWYYIEVGETGGWCTSDKIIIIK